jgi:hypothetical protein
MAVLPSDALRKVIETICAQRRPHPGDATMFRADIMTFIRKGFAAAAAALLASTAAWAEPITIKFAHVVPATGHPKGEAVAYFKQLIDERLAGKVEMEV